MPAWVWWGLITLALCGFSWLYGRFSRPQAPAGAGSWGTSWAVYFSPNGGALQAVLERIRRAQRTIFVHAYLWRSKQIAGALVRAHLRGVQVHVILDANAQRHYPPVQAVALLLGAGITISLDERHTWAHDKVMILDEEIVITGSYNWTHAAEKENAENLLVVRDPRLAEVYVEHWRHHANHSTRYRGTVPVWTYFRVAWGYLLGRRRKRWHKEIGKDC